MPKKDNRLIIYEKTTNLIIYSKNLLNKYPKSERFDLCADIKNILYQIIELIIFAWKEKNSLERIKILNKIDAKLYLLKTLTKLSHEFRYITDKNFMAWNVHISEIGKMVGGWIKACQ